jgi:hypothetical protein
MIIFERLGGWGLGNSLFQIATTISIALDNNMDYYFPNNCNFKRVRFNQNSFFKNELPWIDLTTIKNFGRWGTGDIKYIKPPIFNKTTIIDGFFQSEKYFKHHRDKILKLFDLKDVYKEHIKNKYKHILNNNSCSLHIRRGDYLNAREMKILDLDYYRKAVKYFNTDTLFVIFSDDINWCKENFGFIEKKIFIEEKNDLLEMYLMSLFTKNIIANSTFSWWGAWLGNNNEVIMPNPDNNWFSDIFYEEKQKYSNYKDLICENWKVI